MYKIQLNGGMWFMEENADEKMKVNDGVGEADN